MLELAALKTMVQRASDLTEPDRNLSERDRDYYSGHQLTAAQKAEYAKRRTPLIVNNRIQRKIDAMVGIEQNGRTDPRAFPRAPGDEQAADIATKALVFVDDITRFDAKRSEAFENLLVEGYGGVEVVVEERRGLLEVAINRLRWEDIFFDPYSREKDFSDATFLGVMRWMTLDQALELYEGDYQPQDGNEAESLEDLLQATMEGVGNSYDDRPEDQAFTWADLKQKRVRVAQMYYRQRGVWYLCVFTGGGTIIHQESPYLDEDGKTACPIILMTGYVDRKNCRFGVVRSLISMQDEINARRSRILQDLFNRQVVIAKGAVDAREVQRQLAKPDGVVEVDPDVMEGAREGGMKPFEVVNRDGDIAAQFSLLTESKEEIDKLGPNASLLGQLTGQQSGRAIMAQQNAGMAELAPIYDSLRDWTIRCYRAMWARMKQFWTEERWIRVTEETEAPQFVGINQFQGWDVDPQTGQIVPQIANSIAEMDVDIIIDTAPDMVTLQQEQFDQLAKMAGSGVPIPPDVLLEASSLRDKAKLIEKMKEANAQAAQAQQAAQQAEQARQDMDTQSQAQLRGAQAVKNVTDAQKTAFEIQQAQTSTAIAAALGLPMPAAGA
ncbi:portal protein [Paracoccus versutus]|uniref:portal protein n=1 Tax=Paracoccus versutus TaxID=34007 RepID=UPI000DF76D5E|nr:hypothetical protein [Paracoccus versutus]RDD69222.1 hypothetical protein DVR11_22620 [Paracoccus versutus]